MPCIASGRRHLTDKQKIVLPYTFYCFITIGKKSAEKDSAKNKLIREKKKADKEHLVRAALSSPDSFRRRAIVVASNFVRADSLFISFSLLRCTLVSGRS